MLIRSKSAVECAKTSLRARRRGFHTRPFTPIFIPCPKSGLRQELIANLRRKHQLRYKHGRNPSKGKTQIFDMVSIYDRSEEIEGRRVMVPLGRLMK